MLISMLDEQRKDMKGYERIWFELSEGVGKRGEFTEHEANTTYFLYIYAFNVISHVRPLNEIYDILELFVHVQLGILTSFSGPYVRVMAESGAVTAVAAKIMADVCENKMSSVLFYFIDFQFHNFCHHLYLFVSDLGVGPVSGVFVVGCGPFFRFF